MKKHFKNIILALSIAPLVASCANQDEVTRLQYQVRAMNQKIEEMKATTVNDIRKKQAASANQIDRLEREILDLQGQLDEAERTNALLSEQNKRLEQSVGDIAKEEAARREAALLNIQQQQAQKDAAIAQLNSKLKAQERNLQAIQNARIRDAERRAQEAKARAEAARARTVAVTNTTAGKPIIAIKPQKKKKVFKVLPRAATTAAPKPQVQITPTARTKKQAITQPKAVATAPKQQPAVTAPQQTVTAPPKKQQVAPPLSDFAKAQRLYDAKQYSKAYNAFKAIASSNAKEDTVVDASYMMAECLLAQQQYDKAIIQYQNIIGKHSTHPKAATATLQQAIIFEMLADNETARMIYKKIVTHYASSPEAAVAQKKLNNL